jgi:hypothetical protein
MFLTKLFGVTGSAADRELLAEPRIIEEIVEKVLLLQANSAAQQKRPLGRGTHVKGTCARAEFEVFDVTSGRDPALAARLARGIFAKPGKYPAIVRFGNSDSKINSDFKPDVRSLSFSVDLTRDGTMVSGTACKRQDFSLQNATILPINDAPAFLAIMKLLTASNPATGLWSLSLKDKLRVMRTLALVQLQTHQKIKPYQQLRYWSNVPFLHGRGHAIKHSATPLPDNPAHPLQNANPNALQDELGRHLKEDGKMSSFSFGLQFLDVEKMTYWGKRHDADFWTENASIEWKEVQSPFYTVARLTLAANSQLDQNAEAEAYFDVTRNSAADSVPLGSINRARRQGEVASRKAREKPEASCETTPPVSVYADVAHP